MFPCWKSLDHLVVRLQARLTWLSFRVNVSVSCCGVVDKGAHWIFMPCSSAVGTRWPLANNVACMLITTLVKQDVLQWPCQGLPCSRSGL